MNGLREQVMNGSVQRGDIRLAAAVAAGPVRNNLVALGLLEGAVQASTKVAAGVPFSFKGQVQNMSPLKMQRMQAAALALGCIPLLLVSVSGCRWETRRH